MSRSDPQPRRKRRRRRSWPRTILLIVFVLAILAGIYACLVRKPQVKAAPAGSTSRPGRFWSSTRPSATSGAASPPSGSTAASDTAPPG